MPLALGLAGVCAFLLSASLTPLLRTLALRLDWVDRPDNQRKLHSTPVPRVGGIPVLIAYGSALALLLTPPFQQGPATTDALLLICKLLPAALVVFATGLVDDIIGLKAWQKLLGELMAVALVFWSGIGIRYAAGHEIAGWWSVPATCLWLLACTNAFNLIDGSDGLATGIGLSATAAIFVAGMLHQEYALSVVTVPLAGALLGFLRYNFHPASVFLGDAGSLSIGFILGCYAIIWSHKSATILAMTAPLMALAIPLLDTALSIARRFLMRQPILRADRAHIHHRLLDQGLTPRRVALLLYGASGLAAACALLQSVVRNEFRGLIIVAFCVAVWLGIERLGYREFSLAARVANPAKLRGQIVEEMRLRVFAEAVAAMDTPDACWHAIRDAAHEFGFSSVVVRLGEKTYTDGQEDNHDDRWSLRIPLSGSDYIQLAHTFTESSPHIAAFSDTLYESLRRKRFSPKNPAAPADSAAHAMTAGARNS